MNINYINSSNNFNTKSKKEGIKYLNSVGNNGAQDNINTKNNNNISSIGPNKKNYNKLTSKKMKIKIKLY